MLDTRMNLQVSFSEKLTWKAGVVNELGFRTLSEGIREIMRRKFEYDVNGKEIVRKIWGHVPPDINVDQVELDDDEACIIGIPISKLELEHWGVLSRGERKFRSVRSFVLTTIREKLGLGASNVISGIENMKEGGDE